MKKRFRTFSLHFNLKKIFFRFFVFLAILFYCLIFSQDNIAGFTKVGGAEIISVESKAQDLYVQGGATIVEAALDLNPNKEKFAINEVEMQKPQSRKLVIKKKEKPQVETFETIKLESEVCSYVSDKESDKISLTAPGEKFFFSFNNRYLATAENFEVNHFIKFVFINDFDIISQDFDFISTSFSLGRAPPIV